jgi:hypothetical protein
MRIFCQSRPIDTNILPIFRKQNVPFSIVFGAAIRQAHGWGQKNYRKRFPLTCIRTLNLRAKIVLRLHAKWFAQNPPLILEERLLYLDHVSR